VWLSSNTCATNYYIAADGNSCVACTTPAAGSYVASLCNGVNNNVFSLCPLPSISQYVTSVCVNGNSSMIGVPTLLNNCSSLSNSSPSEYVKSLCVNGNYNLLGKQLFNLSFLYIIIYIFYI